MHNNISGAQKLKAYMQNNEQQDESHSENSECSSENIMLMVLLHTRMLFGDQSVWENDSKY